MTPTVNVVGGIEHGKCMKPTVNVVGIEHGKCMKPTVNVVGGIEHDK